MADELVRDDVLPPPGLAVFSYGGGVQSTACLVLAAQGRIDFHTFLFCNVGDDSENPLTLRYVAGVARPFAEQHGLQLIELQRRRRDGSVETLMQRIERTQRSVPIPVRMSNGAPGNRVCTVNFKVEVVGRWLKANGATRTTPATVGLGISLDEIHRASTDRPEEWWQRKVYPLLDLRLRRQDCINIIAEAGLPVPPKSSCFFCPYHSLVEWQRLKREQPDLFTKSVHIEELLNTKRGALDKDRVWLTRYARPLDTVVGDQLAFPFDGEDTCESGYCMV